ncbi:hypothetical protein D9M73_267440 [compost metagenome]
MRIDEARRQRMPAQIDRVGLGAEIARRATAADEDNGAIANHNGFGLWLVVVHGDDGAAAVKRVGAHCGMDAGGSQHCECRKGQIQSHHGFLPQRLRTA